MRRSVAFVGVVVALALASIAPALPVLPSFEPDLERATLTPAARELVHVSPLEVAIGPQAPTGPGMPTSHPVLRLAAALYEGRDAPLADRLAHFRDYYASVGYPVPSAAAFDENSSLAFTYNVGDLDRDGIDDVILDQYCTGGDCGNPASDFNIGGKRVPSADGRGPGTCSDPHRLVAVSGQTGAELWQTSLGAAPFLPTGCTMEFVIGIVAGAGGAPRLIAYQVALQKDGQATLVDHSISLFDVTDGKRGWTRAWSGRALGFDYTYEHRYMEARRAENAPLPLAVVVQAENVIINPLLLGDPAAPTLIVQGVGYEAVLASTPASLPGHAGTIPIVHSYQPEEWAARIDPMTGEDIWTKETFQPGAGRSILPLLLPAPLTPLAYDTISRTEPAARAGQYWRFQSPVGDLTGDDVPDLLYSTHEWHDEILLNAEGAPPRVGHIVMFDGASGDRGYEQLVEPAADARYFEHWPENLGDVDADGIDDYAVHTVRHPLLPDQGRRGTMLVYEHDLSIRNGRTGEELWRFDSFRNLDILVLGAVGSDGGTDFALFDWFSHVYGFSNVTSTPITVFDGATGAKLWTATTFAAPADMAAQFATLRANGLPDFDRDGVGDLPMDDPVYLPDLTVIHRQTFRSGRDGAVLFPFTTVGAFSIASRVGDLNADGVDDASVMSGDVLDLWITTYDGATGEPTWSRRVLAPRDSSPLRAVPLARYHALATASGGEHFLFNLQLQVTGSGGGSTTSTLTPQLSAYEGANGSAMWSIPALTDGAYAAILPGATPASTLYHEAIEARSQQATALPVAVGVGLGAGVGLYAVGFLVAYALTRRIRS